MPTFAFIDCGDQGKVSKDDNWVVRSHCMLGKNKRSGTRRRSRKERVRAPSKRNATRQIPITTLIYEFVIHVPETLDADPAVYLPGSVNRQSWYLLWRLSQCLPELYPLDHYIDQESLSVEHLPPPENEGALTTALMTASAHNDYVSYQGLTDNTRHLIANTISYLNGLLDKDDVRSRNTAVCTILHLTAVAMLCGEYSEAFIHLYGMSEILRLYKAQQASCDVTRTTCHYIYDVLKFKIERVAFCLYNITGRNGPFFTEPPSWDPLDSDPRLTYEALSGSPKLDSLFYDFHAVCLEVQQKSANRLKVEAQYFRNAMHSLQARVLALPPGEGTPFAECLRLAITAAITSQTQLPMRRMEHPHLDHQFRRYLPLLECPADQQKRNVVLWIMMAAFIVVFDPEEEDIPWAEALFREAAGDTDDWEAVRLRVESVVWFPRYIDAQNEKTFNALRRRWPLQGKEPVQQSLSRPEVVLPLHIARKYSDSERFRLDASLGN